MCTFSKPILKLNLKRVSDFKDYNHLLDFDKDLLSELDKMVEILSIEGERIDSRTFDEHALLNILILTSNIRTLEKKYKEHNIPDDIFKATLKDIKIWAAHHYNIHGKWGFTEFDWLSKLFSFKLFRIRRLQYIFFENYVQDRFCDEEVLINNNIEYSINADGKFKFNNILEVHVPQDGHLIFEECENSLKEAATFFKKTFKVKSEAFLMKSWLLDKQLVSILKESDNIIKFQKLFPFKHPLKVGQHQTVQRVFGDKYQENIAQAPENNVLQIGVKNKILSGAVFDEYIGIKQGDLIDESI